MMDSVEYLGHIIDAGLHTAPHKVEAVIKAPVPSNVKELQFPRAGKLLQEVYAQPFCCTSSTASTAVS